MQPLIMPLLAGECVLLRPFGVGDLPLVQEAAADPYIPLITTVPARGSDEQCLAFIARQHDRLLTRAGYSFAIEDEHRHRAVGQIGFWLNNVADRRARVGYWIASSHRRHGFVRRALSVLTEWGITHAGIARVELYVEPWNTGSWRAAEHVGYTREALLPGWQVVGDQRRDMYRYSRLRTMNTRR
jgi:ribosomal-protein-alanine N-acetyltransferase